MKPKKKPASIRPIAEDALRRRTTMLALGVAALVALNVVLYFFDPIARIANTSGSEAPAVQVSSTSSDSSDPAPDAGTSVEAAPVTEEAADTSSSGATDPSIVNSTSETAGGAAGGTLVASDIPVPEPLPDGVTNGDVQAEVASYIDCAGIDADASGVVCIGGPTESDDGAWEWSYRVTDKAGTNWRFYVACTSDGTSWTAYEG